VAAAVAVRASYPALASAALFASDMAPVPDADESGCACAYACDGGREAMVGGCPGNP
jgi:hypothetical protein